MISWIPSSHNSSSFSSASASSSWKHGENLTSTLAGGLSEDHWPLKLIFGKLSLDPRHFLFWPSVYFFSDNLINNKKKVRAFLKFCSRKLKAILIKLLTIFFNLQLTIFPYSRAVKLAVWESQAFEINSDHIIMKYWYQDIYI